MIVNIHRKEYFCDINDFPLVERELKPLVIRKDISRLDREIALLNDISNILKNKNIKVISNKDRGYISINISKKYNNIYLISNDMYSLNNIIKYDINNIKLYKNDDNIKISKTIDILYINEDIYYDMNELINKYKYNVILSVYDYNYVNYKKLNFMNKKLYIYNDIWDTFYNEYNYYIKENPNNTYDFEYDNLINIIMMVKNAGDEFEKILTENLEYIDRWTILDTGSTDNTINIINKVLKNKRGKLYQEEFINFRDSRNRLLDLANKYDCVFNIMLDDTYILKGNVRDFLTKIRSDTYADSYSLYIKDIDITYSSNRITRPEYGLKYIHLVHEVLENNINASIPKDIIWVKDESNEYMKNRTEIRKTKDLEWLLEEINENPEDPRQYYYMGETYLNLKNYEKAYEWYIKRMNHNKEGYKEERYDSIYKAAVMADLYLKYEWKECMDLYMKAYEYDNNRPEAMFQLGYHYVYKNNGELALLFLKKAFDIDYKSQNYSMNVKIDLYNYYLPLYLIPLCYKYKEYEYGLLACERILNYDNRNDKNNYANYWYTIFNLLKLNLLHKNKNKLYLEPIDKETIIFLMDGGWDKWYGKTLYDKGLGGSETFIIRYAETLAYKYNVLVFCNCGDEILQWNNVKYIPLIKYTEYISILKIKKVFINRYTEYIPLTIENKVDCYLIIHDLLRDNEYIEYESQYLKGILCLTEWHKEYVKNYNPLFENKLNLVSYGIDTCKYTFDNKIKNSFIYSSFPNRGLIHLLRMFPLITDKFPDATLNIFVDFENKWLISNFNKQLLDEMKLLISQQKNIINHGWVNNETLTNFWSISEYWLYPCDFKETCCHTAYQAAASKTLCISTPLAALNDTICDRGILIDGNPNTYEWQNKTLNILFDIMNGIVDKYIYINKNYNWIINKNYNLVVYDFDNKYVK
jgi:hypothetical protein